MFEGAEINVYTTGDEGQVFSFSLSPVQLAIVCRILGLKIEKSSFMEDLISMYTDDTLKQFMEMKGNPLKLIYTGED